MKLSLTAIIAALICLTRVSFAETSGQAIVADHVRNNKFTSVSLTGEPAKFLFLKTALNTSVKTTSDGWTRYVSVSHGISCYENRKQELSYACYLVIDPKGAVAGEVPAPAGIGVSN